MAAARSHSGISRGTGTAGMARAFCVPLNAMFFRIADVEKVYAIVREAIQRQKR